MQEITDKAVGDTVSSATLHIAKEFYIYWPKCVIYANYAEAFNMGILIYLMSFIQILKPFSKDNNIKRRKISNVVT